MKTSDNHRYKSKPGTFGNGPLKCENLFGAIPSSGSLVDREKTENFEEIIGSCDIR